MRAENTVELAGEDAQRMQKLLDVLEDLDDVQAVYHNAEMRATMKVLVIGGGGREHALAWKLAQSPRVQTVFVAPGNGGTAAEPRAAATSPITDLAALADFAQAEKIALTVVGPEAPLAAGVGRRVPRPRPAHLRPDPAAAQLESSKAFAKDVHAAPRDPDRAATSLRRRRGGARVRRPRAARRSSSRPTAWRPARAWSSRRRATRRTRRSTDRCSATAGVRTAPAARGS